MTPERWKQIETLYQAARELEEAEREGLLGEACDGDEALRREVESLLGYEGQAAEFIESPALDLAARELAEQDASCRIGKRIGSYEVLSLLGRGGMGEVYLAADERLDRKVALKFLPEAMQQDPTARQRFLREAKSAAALDHPFICKIYEVGESDGAVFIAMEYVQGETLERKLAKGRLPLKATLEKAVEIAEALEVAHKRHIVHRDLKPSNILITPEGHAKVMDFGLAKRLASAEDETQRQTVTPNLSQPGMTLGTLAYMSPEQVRGEAVDTRSDIFAFGVVLYEMLTGAHPFRKSQAMETGHAILNDAPAPLSKYLDRAPSLLQHTVRKMLAKEPERRYQHVGDVRIDLAEVIRELDSPLEADGGTIGPTGRMVATSAWSESPPVSRLRAGPLSLRVLIVGLLLAGSLLLAAAIWFARSPDRQADSAPERMFRRLTGDTGLSFQPALSPDGKLLAYSSDRAGEGNLDVWVKQMAGGDPIRLTYDAGDDTQPSFSPDGARIAFRSEREPRGIYVVSTLGGDASLIAKDGRGPRFSPDGKWIAYWVGDIHNVPCQMYVAVSTGGAPTQLQPGFVIARYPVWSPDGQFLLFQGRPAWDEPRDWWIVPASGGEPLRTGVFETFSSRGIVGMGALWLADPDRVIVPVSEGDSSDLWQLSISRETGRVTGDPIRLTTGTGFKLWFAGMDDKLVFSSVFPKMNVWSLPVQPNEGKVTGELERLTDIQTVETKARLSADGKKLAFFSYRSGNGDIWFKDLGTGKEIALTTTQAPDSHNLAIAADGTRVAYAAQEGERFSVYLVTPGGIPERLCEKCVSADGVYHWSSDQETVLAAKSGGIVAVDVPEGNVTELLFHPDHSVFDSRFSPDNQWVAFHSLPAPGRRQLFVAPFQRGRVIPESEWIPLTDGLRLDGFCWWSPDGNLLYFISDRDGFRCIWAQPLHPSTKRPVSDAFSVYHFHQARRSMMGGSPGWLAVSVGADKMVFSLGETTGNIWMLAPGDRQ